MELRQLRYFLAVADELHFTRAAERLRIAPPSLSQQVKALERQLKLQLFERSSTGVKLTEAGTALVPLARATVSAADEVARTAGRLSAGRSDILRVGFQPFAFTTLTREMLAAFASREPAIDIQLKQYEWDDPSAGLLDNAVDVALVRPPFRGADILRMVELQREPLLLVVPAGHPLARQPKTDVERVRELPFLESPQVTDPTFAAFWYLHDTRTTEAVGSQATTVEEWLGEIALGRGVNLVPASFADEYRRPSLAYLPVTGLPPTTVVLAWKPTATISAAHSLQQFAARQAQRQSSGRTHRRGSTPPRRSED